MSTAVNLKVLNMNRTGFSFSQNLLSILGNFELIVLIAAYCTLELRIPGRVTPKKNVNWENYVQSLRQYKIR